MREYTDQPIRMHLFNPFKQQSTGINNLKKQLSHYSIKYTYTRNVNDLANMDNSIKHMIVIDTSSPFHLQLPTFGDHQKVYLYPRKNSKYDFKHLANIGLIRRQYKQIIDTDQTTTKIKIRSLCHSPRAKSNYTKLMLHRTDHTNQNYQHLFKSLKDYPDVEIFSEYSWILTAKIPKNWKIIILTNMEGYQQLNQHVNINLYRLDICIYGIKPLKTLMAAHVMLATDDYHQIIDYLTENNFKLSDAKLKLAYLQKGVQSKNTNNKKQPLSNKKTSIIIGAEVDHKLSQNLDSKVDNQIDNPPSHQLINPTLTTPPNIEKKVESINQLDFIFDNKADNQPKNINILQQQKYNDQPKVINWKVYINKDKNKFVTEIFEDNHNKLHTSKIKPDQSQILLNSSIKKSNSNQNNQLIPTKKNYIPASQIIQQLSEQNHKSIAQSFNTESLNRVNISGKRTLSEKIDSGKITKNLVYQKSVNSTHSERVLGDPDKNNIRNSSINVYNEYQVISNDAKKNTQIPKKHIQPLTMEKIEQISQEKINYDKANVINLPQNHQLSHSIIFQNQDQNDIKYSDQKNIQLNLIDKNSFAAKSENKANYKVIKGLSNYHNRGFQKIIFNQNHNNQPVSNEETIVIYQSEDNNLRDPFGQSETYLIKNYLNQYNQKLESKTKKQKYLPKNQLNSRFISHYQPTNVEKIQLKPNNQYLYLNNSQSEKPYQSNSTRVVSPPTTDRVVYSKTKIYPSTSSRPRLQQRYKAQNIAIETSPKKIQQKVDFNSIRAEQYFSPIGKVISKVQQR